MGKQKTVDSFFKRNVVNYEQESKRPKVSTSEPQETANQQETNEAPQVNSRFNENSMKLLSLSSNLASKEVDVDQICLLVEKYYPNDFTEQERGQLKYQLELFNIDMTNNTRLSGASTLAHLCQILVETKKSKTYHLLGRVIRLILTLSVSTATTERAFSAMKLIKTRLRNKMSDESLVDSLVVYIEREIVESFDSESIIEEFKNIKGRRAEL